jgi:hypothetical protein
MRSNWFPPDSACTKDLVSFAPRAPAPAGPPPPHDYAVIDRLAEALGSPRTAEQLLAGLALLAEYRARIVRARIVRACRPAAMSPKP